ncbi:MAG: hypothetical protein FWD61_13255 [Phycisphaerales bacterium]|nr:hypothetical protein [Phycisphaerales bacterium]
MPDSPPIVAPVWHLRRAAELCLPAEAREAFIAECLAAAEVIGDTYTMLRERFDAIQAKWRPHSRCKSTSSIPGEETNEEAIEAKKYPNGFGTLARNGIAIASLGMAKPIATAIAKAMGKPDCGCLARMKYMNRLVPDVATVGVADWIKLTPKILAVLGA